MLVIVTVSYPESKWLSVKQMIENQEELRTALEKNREQLKQIKVLESAQLSKLDGPPHNSSSQLKELKANVSLQGNWVQYDILYSLR